MVLQMINFGLNISILFEQIVGHSLGGGTAALLTYILREQKELSTTTCVTFAPGLGSLHTSTNCGLRLSAQEALFHLYILNFQE